MFDITKLNPCELVALASTLSIYIAQQVSSSDEINMLADFFSALGDNLAILSSDT